MPHRSDHVVSSSYVMFCQNSSTSTCGKRKRYTLSAQAANAQKTSQGSMRTSVKSRRRSCNTSSSSYTASCRYTQH